ncbi:hypothetical protein SAY86_017000 [Trapa natans]|uniref:Uncharacterized protein n=1 Tax=Trapa natans TaxID=22666 RepID=A0AAN7M4I5_TRANT|nr:hypothetical protein SAY86_017000 [Trapa natans]
MGLVVPLEPSSRSKPVVLLTLSTRTTQSSRASAKDPSSQQTYAAQLSKNLPVPLYRLFNDDVKLHTEIWELPSWPVFQSVP